MHVQDYSSGQPCTIEMPDYVALRAALEAHGIPREDWPVYSDATRFLFALDRDLIDIEQIAGPDDDGEEMTDAR